MIEGTEDRRVRRTRHRLKRALLELIREKRYGAITIREITERADVGRSTFYSHYESKEDLLFSGFDSWLLSFGATAEREGEPPGEASEGSRGGEPGFAFSLPLLRHAARQKRFFDAVVVRGGGSRVRRRITELLAEAARRELAAGASPGTVEAVIDARAHAVAGAFLGLLGWWLNAGQDMLPEQVDRVFQRAVGGAFAAGT